MTKKATRNPIIEAVKIAGNQAKLAAAIGCTQQHVSLLVNGAKVSAELAVAIERATNIPRHRMRPDLFEVSK